MDETYGQQPTMRIEIPTGAALSMKYQVHLEYTSTLGTDIHVQAECIEEAEEIARELFNNGDLGGIKWYGVDGEGL
jgi:hypothetical protein